MTSVGHEAEMCIMDGLAQRGPARIWWYWYGLCGAAPGFVTVEDTLKERCDKRLTIRWGREKKDGVGEKGIC